MVVPSRRHSFVGRRTGGKGAQCAVMQGDGNFVIYNTTEYATSSNALWATGTNGNPGAYLCAQDDGNLVVYSSSNQPLWLPMLTGTASSSASSSVTQVATVQTVATVTTEATEVEVGVGVVAVAVIVLT